MKRTLLVLAPRGWQAFSRIVLEDYDPFWVTLPACVLPLSMNQLLKSQLCPGSLCGQSSHGREFLSSDPWHAKWLSAECYTCINGWPGRCDEVHTGSSVY